MPLLRVKTVLTKNHMNPRFHEENYMDEYINREDTLLGLQGMKNLPLFNDEWNAINKAIILVKAIPASDVTEVVRCKDCEHFLLCFDGSYLCDRTKRPIDFMFYCGHGMKRKDYDTIQDGE